MNGTLRLTWLTGVGVEVGEGVSTTLGVGDALGTAVGSGVGLEVAVRWPSTVASRAFLACNCCQPKVKAAMATNVKTKEMRSLRFMFESIVSQYVDPII